MTPGLLAPTARPPARHASPRAVLLAVFVAALQSVSSSLPAAESAARAPSAERPNIVYVMADDLGYGDLGCYGQQVVATPNVDRMAREGIRFTDHYAGHTVCRPSRLVLMTGRHTGHTAISSNAGHTLQPGDRTVTSLLKQAGYATGGIGKWALGNPGTTGAPGKQGFDFWCGYLDQSQAHNYYPEHLWISTPKGDEKLPLEGNVIGDKKRVAVKRETYSHDVMTDHALEFVRRHADEPFFLQMHYTIPHANNEGGRATGNGMEVPDYAPYAKKDWPETEKGFAAMVHRLDRDVGRLLELLKELGIDERTVVFFTSDNGPHQEGGHKMEFFDSNGELRGYKRDLYDGGIRVPLVVRWPGTIEAGRTSDHPSAFQDFLPTACELAGIEPPKDIDGISYVPELLGSKQPRHDFLYWEVEKSKTAVRKGDWKAVIPGRNKPLELFDLSQDLGEQNDLAAKHPRVVEQMQQIIDDVRSGKR